MGKFALGIRQRQRHRGPAHQRESGVRCAFLAPGRQRTDATSQLCHDSVIILTQTIRFERYCRCIVVACTTAFMGEGGALVKVAGASSFMYHGCTGEASGADPGQEQAVQS